ncbi:hypothetical protein HUG10_21485 (plasmid) [Halorarum halophilum]|uniref:Uncharacterized protein n=1 Tax=Halorarum halophilum TaxID=2743090 RepID=A0A7D5L342_9EURY|nr:hypothetical protein [Halobaculum halophilum]QLG30163.1 hypothetical protein HUG10_21485 [Halobaculum halophilum]
MSWETAFDDRYQEMAWVVADQQEMLPEYTGQNDYQLQLDAIRAGTLDLSAAIRGVGRHDEDALGTELARLLVAVHQLSVSLDVSPWEYYRDEQKNNMNKTGVTAASGSLGNDQ